MSAFHQVVFTGELKPGVNPEQAAREFAAVFKIPEEKARQLILDGQEHVLKREVDDANAERYREVLEEIGLVVRIEPAGTPAGAAGAPSGRSATGAPAAKPAPPLAAPTPNPTNPYAPPRADLAPPVTDEDGPMTGPQSVPAGHGWLWLKDAYALCRAKPGSWFGAIALIYVINFVLSLVPLVGLLASFLLGPVFAGGLMAGARELDRRGRVSAGMAFDGFSGPALQLALVGLLYLVGVMLAALVAGVVVVAVGATSSASLGDLSSSNPEALAAAMSPLAALLIVLVFMALLVPLLMAYWFAPALVMLEGMSAPAALKASFRGCLMNILPFLVYGLATFGLTIAFALAMGLVAGLTTAALGSAAAVVGFILVVLTVPILLAFAAVIVVSQYTGYRDIFRHVG